MKTSGNLGDDDNSEWMTEDVRGKGHPPWLSPLRPLLSFCQLFTTRTINHCEWRPICDTMELLCICVCVCVCVCVSF